MPEQQNTQRDRRWISLDWFRRWTSKKGDNTGYSVTWECSDDGIIKMSAWKASGDDRRPINTSTYVQTLESTLPDIIKVYESDTDSAIVVKDTKPYESNGVAIVDEMIFFKKNGICCMRFITNAVNIENPIRLAFMPYEGTVISNGKEPIPKEKQSSMLACAYVKGLINASYSVQQSEFKVRVTNSGSGEDKISVVGKPATDFDTSETDIPI